MPVLPRTTLLLLSVALAACQNAPPPAGSSPAAATASASASASGESSSPLSLARRLALAKPPGTSAIDRELARLQPLVEKQPGQSEPWVQLGRVWVRKAREASDPGFYLNAKACADLALDAAPNDRSATNLLGLVLVNDHRFDDARDLAAQILAKSPEDLMALGTLSDALVEQGRYDEAIRSAEKMVQLKPNLPSYSRVSYLQWLRGDVKAAKESARLAIDSGRDPREPEPRCWALVQAAMIFWHEGDAAGADAGFEDALKACSDYPPALVGRGRVAMARGDFARAIDYLDRAYKQSPLVETAWLLGDAREAAGDEKGAELVRAELVKHGRQVDGRTLSQFFSTRSRDQDEAVQLAQAEKKVRDDIYTEDALAWALYRKGDIPGARAASDKAMALGTKDARLLYHAGAIRIAAGEKAAGEKLVREALKLTPAFDRVGAAEAAKLVPPEKSPGG
jgi:tetratricopeptide (TPR) repeat protein